MWGGGFYKGCYNFIRPGNKYDTDYNTNIKGT